MLTVATQLEVFTVPAIKDIKGMESFFAAKLYLTIFILHSVSFFNDSCLKNGEKQECY